MRVLDQARLWFKEGNSDKVYEVDLVEVADGQFVVNFRYGRRGSALRDGTKTPVPVPLEKARAVFAALIAEKTKGGYRPMDGSAAPPPSAATGARASSPARDEKNKKHILDALKRGHRGDEPLHLNVRKAGERGLREAEPLLLELLAASPPPQGMKPEIWRHLLISALARCGSSTSIAPLATIANDAKAPLHVRNLARLALTMIDRARSSDLARSLVAPALPKGTSGDAPAIIRTLETLLVDDPARARAAVFGLYLIEADDAAARRIVLAIARVARLTGGEFGLLRTLYRAAELKRDGELFAIVARRFETLRDHSPRDTPTLRYFRRRVARFLRRLGSSGSPDYAKMAAALLMAYRDADAEPVRDSGWGRWDAFARYHALNFVLYQNSPRYERADHKRATWRCQKKYRPGGKAPNVREEAFPSLWDRAPEILWQVGRSQAATIAIELAVRALRTQTHYLAQVSNAELSEAMAQAHPLMRRLAFDSARTRPADLVLARGALSSGIDEADDWVLAWVKSDTRAAISNGELLALLMTARSAKVRDEFVNLARANAIDPAVARRAVPQAIAILLGLEDDNERAAASVAVLLRTLADALDAIDLQVARDLLAHSLPAVAELGGEMVLRRSRAGALPAGLLNSLLDSPHPSVRSIGARVVGETPPAMMKDEADLLISFALSPNVELRTGTRKLIGEVARLYPETGRAVASRLIDALLTKQEEGAPAHVVSLLRHELAACLPLRDAKNILALIGALSPHAREAGGLLLGQLGADDLGLEDIIRLANNEILLIRRGAWSLAEAAAPRFKLAPAALGRLCDAKWQDTRDFAFSFVRTKFAAALSADAIIAICDSTQPIVEAFGQSLMLEHWKDADAGHYLLRLSEHPSTNIQLLVSGLLARHAAGKLEVLKQLLPFVLTVLSRVNRGGVAKHRVLDFLRAESVASPEAAALLGPILDRQSLTRAITHKAPLIATMVAVHDRHPDVPLPIRIVNVRGPGAV